MGQFTRILCGVFSGLLVLAGNVDAAPLTSIGGTYGSGNLSANSVQFTTPGLITVTNPASGLVGATVSDLTIDQLGNIASLGGGVTQGPGNFLSTTFTITLGLDVATFTLTEPFVLTSTTPNVGTVSLSTPIVLTSGGITGIDLTLFTAGNGGGVFTFSGNGVYANVGNPGQFTNPGGGVITGSFSLTAQAVLAPIPEPATLALFGGGAALFGAYFARRRLTPTVS